MGSPNLQTLAFKRYHAHKAGLTDDQMIREWALEDAILELDSIDAEVIKTSARNHSLGFWSVARALTIKRNFLKPAP